MAFGSSHARQSEGTCLEDAGHVSSYAKGIRVQLDSSADALQFDIDIPSKRASTRSFIFLHIADTLHYLYTYFR